ncbi:MAG: hypothetical protein AAGE85_15850 [Pseudomonadota bacterium]
MWLLPALALAAACGIPAKDTAADTTGLEYDLHYDIEANAANGHFEVELSVGQASRLLREIRFSFDPARFGSFDAQGELQVGNGELRWFVPESGGTLSWRVDGRRQRAGNGYDAWLGNDWGLLRAERLIPRAETRAQKAARSRTSLSFDLPRSWSAITQYPEEDGAFVVRNPQRRYDEPSGWIVLGKLGVRFDDIAGTRVLVAGPENNGVRRMDMLAFLNWTLPEVRRLVAELPPRLTIVSAGAPMWRGGLSASDSLYMHAERPLISENGTSTLLHEVLHVALGLRSNPGFDWIVEGLAEYYSLELLRRAGGLSDSRHAAALEMQRDWARDADVLCADPSKGARTARAVTLFAELDREIRSASDNEHSLDDIVAALLEKPSRRLNLDVLQEAAGRVLGSRPEALASGALPGCAPMARAEGDRL